MMQGMHELLEILLLDPIFIGDGQYVAESIISLKMMKHDSQAFIEFRFTTIEPSKLTVVDVVGEFRQIKLQLVLHLLKSDLIIIFCFDLLEHNFQLCLKEFTDDKFHEGPKNIRIVVTSFFLIFLFRFLRFKNIIFLVSFGFQRQKFNLCCVLFTFFIFHQSQLISIFTNELLISLLIFLNLNLNLTLFKGLLACFEYFLRLLRN